MIDRANDFLLTCRAGMAPTYRALRSEKNIAVPRRHPLCFVKSNLHNFPWL